MSTSTAAPGDGESTVAAMLAQPVPMVDRSTEREALEDELAERPRIEAELRDALARERRAREEAERAVRFNEMFASMLGHDLRNPISAIAIGASYIARTSTTEKITRTAARILSSTERMSRMIEQLLAFSRLRADGALPLHPVRIDLAELCTRVKDELEAAHPECSIAIALEGTPLGAWDRALLARAFSTVIGNAVVHGTPGHPVTAHLDGRDPERVMARIHNAGAIPPEVLPILFEPYRATLRQHQTQGLGLGLFIASQIVRAHGGTMEAASSAAEGTALRICLPRGAETTAP